jgi:uncharacterized membrane protein
MKFLRSLAWPLMLLLCVPLTYDSLVQAQSPSVVTTANLTFTTIDVPGAYETDVSGINQNGDIVGWSIDSYAGPATGFLLRDGSFTFLNYPGARDTVARSINDSGLIVGYAYIHGGADAVGYRYDGAKYTTLRIGTYPYTYADGINNAGAIVGGYGLFGSQHGFERAGRKFKDITPPPGNWMTALATSVNNLGQVVGLTVGSDDNGFLFSNGKFKTISVPGSGGTTVVWGINDSGIVVGSYFGCTPSCAYHGFAFMKGTYLSFDYPGAKATFAWGINSLGQIVGSYSDGNAIHGFVAAPANAIRWWKPRSTDCSVRKKSERPKCRASTPGSWRNIAISPTTEL